ncbi:unnamed protein product [Rotaria sp. Silwood1]|nr:unnamed protein product [Rotaria sp. Silwood1]CAF3607217.1 unnamed protein product [Rotaria sp. Silwood1]CAF3666217.1 unnamed protein product [Rotaria sp. Silwood1]CAF4755879.1 unnamed protein product [Rotaria sp. Silwood1]
MAREQRLEDLNESRYQRQREESRQGELATSQYQDELLVAYIKDMAKYLEKGNGSLTSNNVMATVARVKTLNIFRQLDPQRNVRIIRFLYEAGQLTKTQERPSLDISTAELRDIDFLPPLRASSTATHPNARWQQEGHTVAGGNGQGNGINQLSCPLDLFVDDDQTVYVVDQLNHRIVEWKSSAASGQVVAGGNGQGSGAHQLSNPLSMIVDKETDNLIICDRSNRRVVRWPRQNGTIGEISISNINCIGLTMDENGSLYAVDEGKHEVRRYRRGESQGIVVAGDNGRGNRLHQLNWPCHVFVNRDHSVYVSDCGNHRVMKWVEGAKQGIVVAGGQGEGNDLTQLSSPQGVVVDQLGTVYVTDLGNNRIMRWPKGAIQGTVIVGGNGQGGQSNQLNKPFGLSFDRHGNFYVADFGNHRVQKFNIDSNA